VRQLPIRLLAPLTSRQSAKIRNWHCTTHLNHRKVSLTHQPTHTPVTQISFMRPIQQPKLN
jgi:hypothetical protein